MLIAGPDTSSHRGFGRSRIFRAPQLGYCIDEAPACSDAVNEAFPDAPLIAPAPEAALTLTMPASIARWTPGNS